MGFDALAVYVHKDNPLSEITVEQLTDLYAEWHRLMDRRLGDAQAAAFAAALAAADPGDGDAEAT